jgi:predicted metal-dependent peptidase
MMTDEKFLTIAQDLEIYHGIFSKFWQMGKPTIDPTIKTAAIRFNKKGGFFMFCFNPDFYNTLDDYNLRFIICHEALHVILNHGYRSLELVPEIANVAMDVVINESLVKNFGFDRYKIQNQQDLCWYTTVFDANKSHILIDKNFEHYYDILCSQATKTKNGGNPKSGGKNNTVDDHSGFTQQPDIQNEIDQKVDDMCDALNPEELKSLKDKIEKTLDTDTKNGLTAGTHKGGLAKLADITPVPKKRKWETVIKRWASQYFKYDDVYKDQWIRTNRRFISLQSTMFIPTEMDIDEFTLEKNRIRIVFFLDTSGSCAHLADRFFKAAKTLPEHKFDIKLCCFDTSVYETSLKTGKLYGFGGTSFSILETYCQDYKKQNNGRYPDAIFVITDGAGDTINPETPNRWYWFLSTNTTYCIHKECNIFNLSDYE